MAKNDRQTNGLYSTMSRKIVDMKLSGNRTRGDPGLLNMVMVYVMLRGLGRPLFNMCSNLLFMFTVGCRKKIPKAKRKVYKE